MKTFKYYCLLFFLTFCSTAFQSCGGDDDSPPPPRTKTYEVDISFPETGQPVTLLSGEQRKLVELNKPFEIEVQFNAFGDDNGVESIKVEAIGPNGDLLDVLINEDVNVAEAYNFLTNYQTDIPGKLTVKASTSTFEGEQTIVETTVFHVQEEVGNSFLALVDLHNPLDSQTIPLNTTKTIDFSYVVPQGSGALRAYVYRKDFEFFQDLLDGDGRATGDGSRLIDFTFATPGDWGVTIRIEGPNGTSFNSQTANIRVE